MKGDAKIIQILNSVLGNELVAINQYFLHARMYKDWGMTNLADKEYHESIDEMKHAEKLIGRILFLEGVPNVQRLWKINIGETVPEQLKVDLALEVDAVKRLNEGIEACRAAEDNASRMLIEEILEDEEEHIDWIEAQIDLIEQVGAPNYLAQQIKKEE